MVGHIEGENPTTSDRESDTKMPLPGPTPLAVSESPPRADSSHFTRIRIAGAQINNVTQDEALSLIDGWIQHPGSRYMVVVNAAKLVEANRNEELRRAIMNADLVTADGMSVVWASRLLGRPLKERVTGIDLFERLVGKAAARGSSVYFLGAHDESVRGVVERFTREYPGLKVAGCRNGYFTTAEADSVAEEIRRSGADLLFAAMGSPRQDIWIPSHIVATGVRFALGVGGSFDHLSGRSRRAPKWMQRAGLEWLFRLLMEPRRLWRRYLVGNSIFIWLVAKQLMGRDEQKAR
jgi:N-acetylglucosaminyldiphosphoundecaprenol N-acetyl-beta-D-mannosaminyltransferase